MGGDPVFVPWWIELVVLPLHLILILLSILVLAVAPMVGALFSPFTLALIDVLNLMMLSCKELASCLLLYQPGFRKEVTEHAHLCQTPNPKPEGRSTESRDDRPCSLSCTSVIPRLLHSRQWQHTSGSAWTVTHASVLLHTHHWGLTNMAVSFFFEWTNCGSERLSDLLRITQCTSLSWVLQFEVWPQLSSKQWF